MTPTSSSSRSSGWATAAGVGAILLWCWSGPCFAAGSRALGAMPFLAFSCVVGVATAMLYHRSRGGAIGDLFRQAPRVILMGFFGVSVYTVALVWAVGVAREQDIAQVMLINYLWPIWMVLLAIALLDEKPRVALVLAGAALGFAGVVVARGWETFTRPPLTLIPHALALVCGFLWALYSVLLRRWRVPEEQSGSTLQFILCALLAAVVGLADGGWGELPGRVAQWSEPPTTISVPLASTAHATASNSGEMSTVAGAAAAPSRSPWSSAAAAAFWVLFCGVGPIGLAYYWWEIGMKRGAAGFLALLAYFIPIVSALLVVLLFKESLSPGLFPGAALITLGAYLGKRATRRA